MKYIRTKDKILVMSENYHFDTFNEKKVIVNSYGNFYQVIKEADTIEELCDEFVILGQHCRITGYGIITIYNNYVRAIVKKFGKAKQSYNKNKGFALYGAIWIDKGLIYVAKLNEKGEWELI